MRVPKKYSPFLNPVFSGILSLVETGLAAIRFLFNGYQDSVIGLTYTGGEIAVKDWENKLQISPANVVPSGGRWTGSEWVDDDGSGNDLHPYDLVPVSGKGTVKDYRTIALRTDADTIAIGDERQWGGFYFTATTGGTTDTGAPAVGAIGDTGIVDNDVRWTNSGHYKLERRYLNLGAVTNKCLADYPRPVVGSELATNGDFSGTWTGEIPADHTATGTINATNYIEKDDVNNRVRIVSDGTFVGIAHDTATATEGKVYQYTVDVHAIAAGQVRLAAGGVNTQITETGVTTGNFIATASSAVTLVRAGTSDFTINSWSIKEIADGLGTVSAYDGVSAFRNNISNLTLSGDTAATLTVVAIPAADLESAVDEHGETVDLSDYVQTYDGDYLGYELDNSGGAGNAFATVGGTTGNTNNHTMSVYAYGVSGGVVEMRWISNSDNVGITATTILSKAITEDSTPTTGAQALRLYTSAGSKCRFIIPNLTETAATQPLMEANTTRAANVLTATWPSTVSPSSGAISLSVIPMTAGQVKTLLSNYTDADNYIEIHCDATTLYFNKRVAGTDHESSVAYSHTAITEVTAQVYWDATGSGIRYSEDGGAFSAYGTDADTTDAVLSGTLSLGHKNDLNQIYSFEPEVKFYATKADMEA